jgi:hypothetical protein
MEEAIKICRDCVFYKNPICLRTGWADPITGEIEFYEMAKSERWGRYDFSCGKDAKFFEPKPIKKPFWKFWSR